MREIGFLLVLMSLSGCATLFSDDTQRVSFTSSPEGAEVLMDGRTVGVTPVIAVIDRDSFKRRIVTMRMPGYRSVQFELGKSLNPVAILNLSGLLSWATDAMTGNMIEYSPGSYYLELEPQGVAAGAHEGAQERAALRFVLVNHRRLLADIARGDGEHLRAAARLLGVDRQAYPAFARALQRRADELLAREYPHELYEDMAAMGARHRATASVATGSAAP